MPVIFGHRLVILKTAAMGVAFGLVRGMGWFSASSAITLQYWRKRFHATNPPYRVSASSLLYTARRQEFKIQCSSTH